MNQAKARPSKQPRQEKPKGFNPFNLILKPIGMAFTVTFYIMISIIVGIAIEWIGISFFWEQDHAAKVLQQEFAYLGDNFSTTLFGMSAENTALKIIRALNGYLWGSQQQPTAGMLVIGWLQQLGQWTESYINAAIYVLMITSIRCVIIVLSTALVLIVTIAAAVDGLHERELRKLGGGNEHGDVYHWAKAWGPRILYMSPVLYLAWPTAINPNYIILPGLFAFFTTVYLFFSKYKKVL